jgi:hypothetical protein
MLSVMELSGKRQTGAEEFIWRLNISQYHIYIYIIYWQKIMKKLHHGSWNP